VPEEKHEGLDAKSEDITLSSELSAAEIGSPCVLESNAEQETVSEEAISESAT